MRHDLTSEIADRAKAGQMYSYQRAAYTFWNGFANALMAKGFTEAETLTILSSKHTRWALDHDDNKVEAMGFEIAQDYLKQRGTVSHLRTMLKECE